MKKYCKTCGYQVDENIEKCPVCSQNNFYPVSNMSLDELMSSNTCILCRICGTKTTGIADKCPNCGVPVGKHCIVVNDSSILDKLSIDDYFTITDISTDQSFLRAMIQLKEKDIIEYELKMSQFRNQSKQAEQIQSQPKPTEKQLTCPQCGSTDITSGTRGFTLTTGFLGSGNHRNVCKKCGFKWKPGGWLEALNRDLHGHK